MDTHVLDRLRAPHPDQKAIDERSAKLLLESSRYSGRPPAGHDRRRRRRQRIVPTPA